jgi:CheY-like chemotaxis protein/HPt (histidine-containing phosphotransfer) domain-containing protein
LNLAVGTAGSGAEGVEMAAAARRQGEGFDLVLVDHSMSDMSGVDVARALREKAPDAHTKAVLMVPMMDLPNPQGDQAECAAGRLSKPIRQGDLIVCLATLLPDQAPPSLVEGKRPARRRLPKRFTGRILLAEDHPVNVEVTVPLLRQFGLEVEQVWNGREALDAWEKAPYDLIFMDCQMPQMDGYEATRRIRAREAEQPDRRPTTIIALTANALSGDREASLEAGMNDHLGKPLTRNELNQILARWLDSPAALADSRSGEELSDDASVEPAARENAPMSEADRPEVEKGAALLDQATLERLRMLPGEKGRSLIEKVFWLYLDTTPALTDELQAAFDQGDLDRLSKAAHGLKSSSANIGALALAETLRQIEITAREGDAAGLPALLGTALEEYREIAALVRLKLERVA